ncbi:flavin reductase family protein [Streptomyces sp. NPDC005953]|uniref:flavin reductase family protein n=1 Tax=unclassified Streptomyces TaxID=2593676 RepID=UPI0033C53745
MNASFTLDHVHGAPKGRRLGDIALAGYGVPADLLKQIAGALPTGVTVVATTGANGEPLGMTSGAVCSVSAEPPLLLSCIKRESSTLSALRERGAFTVNILRAESAGVSDLFARPGADRFEGLEWTTTVRGLPVLHRDTVAHAECTLYDLMEAGDHVIVVGLVLDGAVSTEAMRPLLYFRRSYAGWPEPDDPPGAG